MTVHLGDFDLAGSWIAHESGKMPIVITARLRFHGQQTLFDAVRRAGGMAVYRRGQTSFQELVEKLRAGHIVIVALDRASSVRAVASTSWSAGTHLDSARPACLTCRRSGAHRVDVHRGRWPS